MKERDKGERKMNEREETVEIIIFPLYPHLLQGQQALPNCKPISAGCPGDVRYMTPLPHPTAPTLGLSLSSGLTFKYSIGLKTLLNEGQWNSNLMVV